MGRKKIKITRINDDRNRSVTYLKRKAGLMKKAHELAVLTGSEVAVIVFGQNGKLTEFCSGDMDRVLLRYTEHSGPVERKGPEHYSNDDEDSDEDNEGGDGEDGDAGDGGGNGAAGMGGGPSNHYSPDNGQNGSPSEKGQGREAGKSNKRKAPAGGHRMTDGNSISSEAGSSKLASPPSTSAPIIKVEGELEEDMDEGGVNKGALKAAIIQRSISKPISNQSYTGSPSRPQTILTHHHSFSGGDVDALQHHKTNILTSAPSNGNIHMQAMPSRPYTADAMMDMQIPSSSMPPQQQNRQRISPPRFAFSPDSSNLNPNLNSSNSNTYLRPQGWGDGSAPQLMRASSASALNTSDLSYGDLAGGGGAAASPSGSPYKMHVSQSMSPLPSPHLLNAAQNYATLQSPQHSHSNTTSLLPLAHPILRQHPQYESYANQLRMQQQQMQGFRNASQPIISVHTAPSSPNHLNMDGSQAFSGGGGGGGMGNLELPSGSLATKRSASFGYGHDFASRKDFQQSLQHDHIQFADGEKLYSSHQQGDFYPQNRSQFNAMGGAGNIMPPPPPYGQNDSLAGQMSSQQQQQQQPETPISNAAFQDLMGSILSDMGSSNSGGSTSSEDRTKESLKEQEEVIRSMESDGSLTTLVNSESFDALMTNSDTIKSRGVSPMSRAALDTRDDGNDVS